ncbi:MAG: hypothetical protein LBD73_01270 [Deferribacteraceae bacterium]|jgi:hypothetical protein|nr:hypothetical protein [Deferribacteraceae bacterium]
MKKTFLSIFVFSFIYFTASFADDSVIVTGIGNTPDEAKRNAFINAIEQKLGVMVAADILVENGDMIKDKIYTNTQGYIDNYTVISSGKDGSLFIVTIKASVSRQSILSEIDELNHLNDAKASYEAAHCRKLGTIHNSVMCSGGMISLSNMNYGIHSDSYMLLRYYINFDEKIELLQIYTQLTLSNPGGFYSAEDQLGNEWRVSRVYLGKQYEYDFSRDKIATEAFILETDNISYIKEFIATGLIVKFTGNYYKRMNLNIPSAYIEGFVRYIEELGDD